MQAAVQVCGAACTGCMLAVEEAFPPPIATLSPSSPPRTGHARAAAWRAHVGAPGAGGGAQAALRLQREQAPDRRQLLQHLGVDRYRKPSASVLLAQSLLLVPTQESLCGQALPTPCNAE